MHNFPGHKVLVRCLKLLKPYSKKGVTDVYIEEDEDDDEDYTETGRALPPEGRIMEQDMLSQAYQIGKQNTHMWSLCRVSGCFLLSFLISRENSKFKVLTTCFLCLVFSFILWFKGNPQV